MVEYENMSKEELIELLKERDEDCSLTEVNEDVIEELKTKTIEWQKKLNKGVDVSVNFSLKPKLYIDFYGAAGVDTGKINHMSASVKIGREDVTLESNVLEDIVADIWDISLNPVILEHLGGNIDEDSIVLFEDNLEIIYPENICDVEKEIEKVYAEGDAECES